MNILIGVVEGPAAGQEILAEGDAITIGRDSTNSVPLPDASVSRIHCRLILSDDQSYYRLEDCDSFNGTYVGGERVESMQLSMGDQFKVGSSLLEIRSGLNEPKSHEVLKFHSRAFDQQSSPDFDASEFDTIGIEAADDQAEAYGRQSFEQEFVQTNGDSDLDFVYDVSLMTSRKLNCSDYSRELLSMVVNWAQAEQGVLIVLSEDKKEFSKTFVNLRKNEPESSDGRPAAKKSARFNRRLVNHVIENRTATLSTFSVSSAQDQSAATDSPAAKSDTRPVEVEAMCVPIDNDGSLHALIYLDTYRIDGGPPAGKFSMGMLRVLVSIANQAAARFENQKYVESLLQAAKMSAVGELTSAISHRVNNLLQLASGGSYLVDLGINQGNQENIAKGWEVVKRTQNRISLLATNLSLYSRNFEPFAADTPLQGLIQQAVDNVKDVYEIEKLRIDNQTREDMELYCDAFFTSRAIENLLALALSAAQEPDGEGKEVKFDVGQEGNEVVLKIGFEHYDERFDLRSLFAGDVTKVNAELGMLELLVSRKVVEGQGSTIRVSTDESGYNVITVRFQPA